MTEVIDAGIVTDRHQKSRRYSKKDRLIGRPLWIEKGYLSGVEPLDDLSIVRIELGVPEFQRLGRAGDDVL